MEKKAKAIGLLSGGLDSIVAARLMIEQGIEVEAVNFVTTFCTCTSKNSTCLASQKAADQLGIQLKVFDVSEEILDVIKRPKYGYGSGINPCLDCRIFVFKKAKEYMLKTGADFIFTGEVLGQRPMSQRREAMNTIERDSGVKGYLLRPLCAKLFPPTIAEENKTVDREKLMSISGRSRKGQMSLAKKFNIKDYPCSSGGCLLTDKSFAMRMKDLMKHKPDFDLSDVALLKYGRHFRISPAVKLVVGRNNDENHRIALLKKSDDLMLHAQEPLGPVSILRPKADGAVFDEAVSIVARYALGKDNAGQAKIKCFGGAGERYVNAPPCKESLAISRRI
jgi:tRNA U34 2-thiouridine synthase MnmA/TrmU